MVLRMLRDVPAVGWTIVALAVGRAAATCAGVLLLARLLDAAIAGDGSLPHVAFALVAFAVAAVLAGVEAALPGAAQPREEARWRRRVVRADLAGSIDDTAPTGERVGRATEEVERFAHYRVAFLGPLIAAFVVPLVVLVVIAAAIDAGLALAVAIGVAVIPVVIGWFMARFRASSGRYRMLAGRLTALFLETMRARATIRHLDAADQRRAALAERAEAVRAEVMRLLRRNQIVILVTDAIFGVVMLALLGTAAVWGVAGGWLTAGSGIALLLLSGLLREPVDRLGRSFYVGLAGRAAGERVRAGLAGVASAPGGDEAADLAGPLALRDARIARGDAVPVDGADLVLPEAGLVAVTGRSGAGKSTLALAIAGLVDATGVTIGGRVARARDLRRRVAYLPQRPVLFTGSVRDNLLLARPEAEDDELRAALEAAGFAGGGSELPCGLDTPIGEGAAGVSGGQAQRICIARALLSGRDVLVADEPTAQLDPEGSGVVVDTLRGIAGERLVVMITHRADEARRADTVVVLDAGRVHEAGEAAR